MPNSPKRSTIFAGTGTCRGRAVRLFVDRVPVLSRQVPVCVDCSSFLSKEVPVLANFRSKCPATASHLRGRIGITSKTARFCHDPVAKIDEVEVDDIISYHDLVTEEKAALPKGNELGRTTNGTSR